MAPSGNSKEKLAAIANRLRLIQMDFADEGPEVRRGYIAEEIERGLAGLPVEERKAFLEQLSEAFPTWDPNVTAVPQAAESPVKSQMDQRELQDVWFLLSRLIGLAATFSAEEKEAVCSRLEEAGLVTARSVELPPDAVRPLRSLLGLGDGGQVDVPRVVELAALLADVVIKLDQVAWKSWREMAPHSNIRRTAELRDLARQFVGGDRRVAAGQIKQDVEKFRKLLSGMILAYGQLGWKFGEDHLRKYGPDEISALVRVEGRKGGIFASHDDVCWKKYRDLARAFLSPESINNQILKIAVDLIVRFGQGLAQQGETGPH